MRVRAGDRASKSNRAIRRKRCRRQADGRRSQILAAKSRAAAGGQRRRGRIDQSRRDTGAGREPLGRTVSVFSIAGTTLTPVRKINLGDEKSGPSHVAITPDGKTALVTRDGTIRFPCFSIDGTNVGRQARDLGGNSPYGLAVHPNGGSPWWPIRMVGRRCRYGELD